MKEELAIGSYNELKSQLAFYAEDDYREFAMRGIPSKRPFIGVRIPIVRKMVNSIPRECYTEFLRVKPVAIEEILARGMIICKLPYDEMLEYFDSQISYIDNWCTCDVFCSGVAKQIKNNREEFLDRKVENLLADRREFAVRVGLVILKCGYMEFDYLNLIFDRVETLADREEYYIKMALAWLIAECFIKYPEETFAYFRVTKMPKWTYNKTISKICDSYRVTLEVKEVLRKMRK